MGVADPPPQWMPPLSELPPAPSVPADGGETHPLSLWLELPDPPLQLPPLVPLGPNGLPDFGLRPDLTVPPGPPAGLPPVGNLPLDFGVPPGPPATLPPLFDRPPHFDTPPSARPLRLTPEPATAALLGLGIAAMTLAARHRRG